MQKSSKLLILCLVSALILSNMIISFANDTSTNNDSDNIETKTRLDLLKSFVKSVFTDNGVAEQPGGNTSLATTYYGLELADYLHYKYDLYEFIYYIQKHQKSDYGFSNDNSSNTSLNATYYAVRSLISLGLSSDDLNHWNIFDYINHTISNLLYVPSNYSLLNAGELLSIYRFFIITGILNQTVVFSYNSLTDSLKHHQFANGSWQSFDMCIHSVLLLKILGSEPKDITGTSRYLFAFRFNETGFNRYNKEVVSIEDTYWAINAIIQLGVTVENKQKLVDSILALQGSSGGFKNSENDEVTLTATFYAYRILYYLNALDQLQQLAFIASTGYLVNYSLVAITLTLLCLVVIKKTKKKLSKKML